MPYATNAGVRIQYAVEGSGRPLVLHVGFSNVIADCYQFGYVDALRSDYRVVMLDPRGHGQSDKSHDADAYSPT
jgi:pimeloyl-ACP methyl ester carboxylesterase